jgi:enoyl-[acyl-carrier protein] reductase II
MAVSQLWQRGCAFLQSAYAILGGAMTWVSNPGLVSAISNAGGFGVLAGGAMSSEQLHQAIEETRARTSKTFGVNLITMHPQLYELINICHHLQISHVFLAGGIPSTQLVERLHQQPCRVIGFAPNLLLAQKLIRSGIDALMIEGHEAGGHVGPVSSSVLAQEILPWIHEVPVFVAGGIGRGETMAAYLQMGAAGCQLGTRFACAHESPAHQNFKNALIKAQAKDAVVTHALDARFPIMPVRSIKNAAHKAFYCMQAETILKHERGDLSLKEARLRIEHYWAGALRRAVLDGDVEHGSLMAGQSVGMINREQPVAEIIQDLIAQANAFLRH